MKCKCKSLIVFFIEKGPLRNRVQKKLLEERCNICNYPLLSWMLTWSLQANAGDSDEEYQGPLNLLVEKRSFKSSTYKTVKKNKNLKQILTMERDRQLALDIPTCK